MYRGAGLNTLGSGCRWMAVWAGPHLSDIRLVLGGCHADITPSPPPSPEGEACPTPCVYI